MGILDSKKPSDDHLHDMGFWRAGKLFVAATHMLLRD